MSHYCMTMHVENIINHIIDYVTMPNKSVNILNHHDFINIWAREPIMSAEHKACPWLSCFYLQIPVPLLGKKFTPPKDGSHF